MKFFKILLILCLCFISCKTKKEKQVQNQEESSKLKLPERPNILWLVTEDMGAYIPPFGDSTVVTPNLSKLAKQGVIYPNLYSTSGVCAPSRAAIATGMYPSSIGANHMRTTSYNKEIGVPNTRIGVTEMKINLFLQYLILPKLTNLVYLSLMDLEKLKPDITKQVTNNTNGKVLGSLTLKIE